MTINFNVPFIVLDIHVREYCHWEHFNASCRNNHVIMMHTARYGRMQVGRCVSEEYGHVGCGIDVMDEVEGKCSGRDRCVISVAEFSTKGFRPCPKDVTSYFEASYICQPGKFLFVTVRSFFLILLCFDHIFIYSLIICNSWCNTAAIVNMSYK